MTTKRERRNAAVEKRRRFLAEERRIGLEALRKEQIKRQERLEKAQEAAKRRNGAE